MEQNERELVAGSPIYFPQCGNCLADNFGIGIVRQGANLICGRWIADVADDPDDAGSHFGIVAVQIAIELVQMPIEFSQLEEIDLDLVRLPAIQRIRQVVDVTQIAGSRQTKSHCVAYVGFLFTFESLPPVFRVRILETSETLGR